MPEVPRGYRDVGLNADWCISAYHLGPTAIANTHNGDYYIVDDRREPSDPLSLVRRWYTDFDEQNVEEIAESPDFGALVTRYKQEVAG